MVLVASGNAHSSGDLVVEDFYSTTYHFYKFILVNLNCDTGTGHVYLKLRNGSGDIGSTQHKYNIGHSYQDNDPTYAFSHMAGSTGSDTVQMTNDGVDTTSHGALVMNIFDPHSGTGIKSVTFELNYHGAGDDTWSHIYGGVLCMDTGTHAGFKLYPAAGGNITCDHWRLYGYK